MEKFFHLGKYFPFVEESKKNTLKTRLIIQEKRTSLGIYLDELKTKRHSLSKTLMEEKAKMNKINTKRILASCTCCLIVTAIGAFYQWGLQPDLSPALLGLKQLFPLHMSESSSLVLSGMGLLGISTVAREHINR